MILLLEMKVEQLWFMLLLEMHIMKESSIWEAKDYIVLPMAEIIGPKFYPPHHVKVTAVPISHLILRLMHLIISGLAQEKTHTAMEVERYFNPAMEQHGLLYIRQMMQTEWNLLALQVTQMLCMQLVKEVQEMMILVFLKSLPMVAQIGRQLLSRLTKMIIILQEAKHGMI